MKELQKNLKKHRRNILPQVWGITAFPLEKDISCYWQLKSIEYLCRA